MWRYWWWNETWEMLHARYQGTLWPWGVGACGPNAAWISCGMSVVPGAGPVQLWSRRGHRGRRGMSHRWTLCCDWCWWSERRISVEEWKDWLQLLLQSAEREFEGRVNWIVMSWRRGGVVGLTGRWLRGRWGVRRGYQQVRGAETLCFFRWEYRTRVGYELLTVGGVMSFEPSCYQLIYRWRIKFILFLFPS